MECNRIVLTQAGFFSWIGRVPNGRPTATHFGWLPFRHRFLQQRKALQKLKQKKGQKQEEAEQEVQEEEEEQSLAAFHGALLLRRPAPISTFFPGGGGGGFLSPATWYQLAALHHSIPSSGLVASS